MEITKELYVTHRNEWRRWLKENHDTADEVWLIFYKKHTGTPSIPYEDAVEEALCYGWIDSIVKRVDDEKFVRRFTPRKKKSTWAQSNVKRVKKLINEGKMTEAGLAIIDNEVFNKKKEGAAEKEFIIPREIEEALAADQKVWENFTNLAPGYKRQYIGWVMDAKRKKTRKRRLEELNAVMEKNEKLGMK